MKPDQLLRAILPEVLIDNFDIERFEKSDTRFDIWLDEKKEQRVSGFHLYNTMLSGCCIFRNYHIMTSSQPISPINQPYIVNSSR